MSYSLGSLVVLFPDRIISVLLLVLFISPVFAQNEVAQKYQSNLADWRNGSVQINNSTIIEGLVRYDRLENIVTIKTKEETRSFNAQGIQRFDMDDAYGMKHFISSPNKKTSDEDATCYFFEIIKECKHFALMMQEKAYTYKKVSNPVFLSNPVGFSGQTTRMYTVEKMLYIFDDEGNIKPYMVTTESQGMGMFSPLPKMKTRVLDKRIIKNYMKDRYVEVKKYAKKNKLSFSDKKDLITILTYFKKLESI